MSDKRKKQKFDAKRQRRRLKRLAEDGRLVNGVEIPRGAVLADPSQQVPNNSYSPPPLYYVDKDFTCVDCGREDVWTARQQKWYYEVAKGSLYATATRCRACRRKRSARQTGEGDPNPIKHVGSLMKRIRKELEPCLIKAGFKFDGRRWDADYRTAWLGYARPGLILQCMLRDGKLVAETMDNATECRIVATVDLSDSLSALLQRTDEFIHAVQGYVRGLAAPVESQRDEVT